MGHGAVPIGIGDLLSHSSMSRSELYLTWSTAELLRIQRSLKGDGLG